MYSSAVIPLDRRRTARRRPTRPSVAVVVVPSAFVVVGDPSLPEEPQPATATASSDGAQDRRRAWAFEPPGLASRDPRGSGQAETGRSRSTLHPVAEFQSREYHPAFEEYCEAIFELHEDDVEVIQARIAERLGVSRPAVSEMIRRMESEGLVEIDRTIRLTEPAPRWPSASCAATAWPSASSPTSSGLSWADAHQEAGRWEHVISDAVEAAIIRLLDDPTTCPHGNPIPGTAYEAPDTVALSELAVGDGFTVTRIPEELEFTPGLLEFLEDASIQPGHTGTVTAVVARRHHHRRDRRPPRRRRLLRQHPHPRRPTTGSSDGRRRLAGPSRRAVSCGLSRPAGAAAHRPRPARRAGRPGARR